MEWRVVEVYHIVDRIRSVGRWREAARKLGLDNRFPNRALLGGQLKEKSRVSVLRFVSYKENSQIPWQRESSRLVKPMLLGGPDKDLVDPLFG